MRFSAVNSPCSCQNSRILQWLQHHEECLTVKHKFVARLLEAVTRPLGSRSSVESIAGFYRCNRRLQLPDVHHGSEAFSSVQGFTGPASRTTPGEMLSLCCQHFNMVTTPLGGSSSPVRNGCDPDLIDPVGLGSQCVPLIDDRSGCAIFCGSASPSALGLPVLPIPAVCCIVAF